jgi:hypothetical protein
MIMNYKNCAEHRWPRSRRGGSIRSIGNVEYEQCNNCLTMRILFSIMVKEGDTWVTKTNEKVIEPKFE